MASSFCLVLSEAHLQPCETLYMERFGQIVNGWIQSIKFAKSSILDVWISSEYMSDYIGPFTIVINWERLLAK